MTILQAGWLHTSSTNSSEIKRSLVAPPPALFLPWEMTGRTRRVTLVWIGRALRCEGKSLWLSKLKTTPIWHNYSSKHHLSYTRTLSSPNHNSNCNSRQIAGISRNHCLTITTLHQALLQTASVDKAKEPQLRAWCWIDVTGAGEKISKTMTTMTTVKTSWSSI